MNNCKLAKVRAVEDYASPSWDLELLRTMNGHCLGIIQDRPKLFLEGKSILFSNQIKHVYMVKI